jgi:hypothetical protein
MTRSQTWPADTDAALATLLAALSVRAIWPVSPPLRVKVKLTPKMPWLHAVNAVVGSLTGATVAANVGWGSGVIGAIVTVGRGRTVAVRVGAMPRVGRAAGVRRGGAGVIAGVGRVGRGGAAASTRALAVTVLMAIDTARIKINCRIKPPVSLFVFILEMRRCAPSSL